jgi:serine/threonine protein kinase
MVWAKDQLLQSGKYRIIQQLGGGGFGLTYLAEDRRLQRKVVIKAPNRTFAQEQDYEQFVRRFQREGQVLAKINHSNVVRVIEPFGEAGMPCLVMEYVEGETLNECIRRVGRLPEEEAVRYFRQLATALQTVHKMGLVHCDIHPGNIMLRSGTEPILIDFGSTKSLVPMTYTVTTTVNDAYSPYEQRQGDPQPTWDVYGLAATLYFTVTGQQPQAAVDRKFYGDSLKLPKSHCPQLSGWLNQAILSGMALEAGARSPSMQAWLGLLHPPQENPPTPIVIVPKQEQKINQTAVPFPWSALATLLVGYLPTGIITGLNFSFWAVAASWAWAVAWVVVWAGSTSVFWAGLLAWFGSGSVAVAWIMIWGAIALPKDIASPNDPFWLWAGVGIVIWTLFGVPFVVGTELLTNENVTRIETDSWAGGMILCGTLVVLVGAIVGSFIKSGWWVVGLGASVLALTQFLMIFKGLIIASEPLEQRYLSLRRFLIYSIFSVSGLAIGAGISWWFTLSGVKLPIILG